MSSFVVIGCSYRTAKVDLRERIALPRDELPAALASLRALSEIDEGMIVSTCNRVEVYAAARRALEAERALLRLLGGRGGISPEELAEAVYRYHDDEALAHIFRVASSLDAMVVGEAQVTGQVKDAFATATEAQAVGPLLTRCMQRAFFTAKRVRTETAIARYPASVSSVAVDLATHIFDDLSTVATLIVGAGEMAELAVRHLVGHGASRLRVANRSPERAQQLCQEFGARAVPFDELREQLQWPDVVISSTGSKDPIITRELLAEVMKRRKQRPLFLVDIAVPRDIDPRCRALANVYLFDVDDLERVVAENIRARRKEAKLAERIVVAEVEQFKKWLGTQRAVPTIKLLRQRFTDVARAEAERAARLIGLDGEQQRTALDQMADAIVNKLLHTATMELKRAAEQPDGASLEEATRQLFALSVDGSAPSTAEVTAAAVGGQEAKGQ